MNPVLRDDPCGKALLLGNEAIVRGALEAGVAVATGYPGTPASEIGDTFAAIARGRLLHFEYSVNEKVAFEVAYGASLSGVRAICSMKHLGLNVAADPLVTSAYVGPVGGLVIVSAADPGCHTSPNEQDHRYLARMSWIPLLAPSDPEEARAMTLEAFALSERWRVPVILRPTTRVSHTQGVVTLGPLPPPPSPREFRADPRRFVPVPGIARREREDLLARMREAAIEVDSSPFNSLVRGTGRLGIVATGVSRAYLADAIDDLGLAGEASVLGIGTPFPLPAGLAASFLERCDTVLVVEEMEPFLEDSIRSEASGMNGKVVVRGKRDGLLPWAGEYGPSVVRAALARAAGRPAKEAGAGSAGVAPALPGRFPILCAGCPHRSTFTAVRIAIGDRAVYLNDIGCYTLGYGPPLRTADALLAMGSSIPMAAGIGRASGRKNVAFIGDSTFFHSGITGLVNAAYNLDDLLVIVLDNRITAMTGHQPNPGMGVTGMGEAGPDLRIEEIARACGASLVRVIDPHDQRAAAIAVRDAYGSKGLSVIVSRAPCPVHLARSGAHEDACYEVDDSRCRSCQITCGEAACGLAGDEAHARVRIAKRVLAHPSGTAGGMSPCTASCPANLCVQGYVAAYQAGDASAAVDINADVYGAALFGTAAVALLFWSAGAVMLGLVVRRSGWRTSGIPLSPSARTSSAASRILPRANLPSHPTR